MAIAALCILCLVLGMVSGYEIHVWRVARKDAPAPADPLGYDPQNPMNAGREWVPVEVEGHTFYRVQPWQQ